MFVCTHRCPAFQAHRNPTMPHCCMPVRNSMVCVFAVLAPSLQRSGMCTRNNLYRLLRLQRVHKILEVVDKPVAKAPKKKK